MALTIMVNIWGEKGITCMIRNDANNPAILCFFFVTEVKNTVECSTCAVPYKIETDCFCRNLPVSNDPVIRISRNLATKLFRNHMNDLSQKNLNFDIGNF